MCAPCTPNCAVCAGPGACAVCAQGFLLNGTVCVAEPVPPPDAALRPVITGGIMDCRCDTCADNQNCLVAMLGRAPAVLAGTSSVTLYCTNNFGAAIRECPPLSPTYQNLGTMPVTNASETVNFGFGYYTNLTNQTEVYCVYATDTNQCSIPIGPYNTVV